MLTIINNNTDPRYNLALEEYVLKNVNIVEDIILLWQNEPSVIIGRNQNTIEEINSSFIKEHGIHVVRRISGGGAVYHDFGNLNFTFITNNVKDNLHNFTKFTNPVIKALNSLGIKAEFSGRNDIVVDDKKISGNAQSFHKNRMFHHGTILFDANLDMIASVLQVSHDKIASKGIKSNRSRVTNILPYMENKMTILDFKDYLLKYFLETENIGDKLFTLSREDYAHIEKLMQEKYMTWEWNYGESPQFEVVKTARFAGGKVAFHLNVKDGFIKGCKIFGDFLGKEDISDIENLLLNKKYKEEEVKEVLSNIPLNEYFYNINLEELLNYLF